jgi:mercuric ion transport protein
VKAGPIIPAEPGPDAQDYGSSDKKSGGAFLSTVGSIGAAASVAFCPVCYPAIGAVMAAVGLGFVVDEVVLMPLLIGLIALSWFGLFWSYHREHHYLTPLMIALASGAALLVGRYFWFNQPLMYAGIAGMVGAGIGNLLLRKQCKRKCRCRS